MILNISKRSFPFLFIVSMHLFYSEAQARGAKSTKKTVKTSEAMFVTAVKVPPVYAEGEIKEGPRLGDYANLLKNHYPSATDFREISLLPLEFGGTSFTGLVSRLLGEAINRENEGLKVRRYLYQADSITGPQGVVHGSSFMNQNQVVNVFVFYSAGGTIRHLQVNGLPESVLKILNEGGYLTQFVGRTTDEFEVIRGRRGKILSTGSFLINSKKPPLGESRSYYDKILRSVRFNAAFMDVSYFITRHPDLADKPIHEFPVEVEVTSGPSKSGPEAFIRGKNISGSPVDGAWSAAKVIRENVDTGDEDEAESEQESEE